MRFTHRKVIAYELRIRILEYDPPYRLVSEMQSDFFRVCQHTLLCEETSSGTRLTDNLELMRIDPLWTLRNWLLGPPDLLLLEDRRRLTKTILVQEHRQGSGTPF